jgi:DNA modification methylase
MTEVPVYWVDVDDATARRIMLADNRTNDLATYDDEVLAELLEAAAADDDLLGTGYDGDDLDDLLADFGGFNPIDDPEPGPPPAEPITVLGDLIVMGDHRLICGDCRDADVVRRLVGSDLIAMAFTSPPYAQQRDYDETSGFEAPSSARYVDWFKAVAANVAAHLTKDGSWFVNIKAASSGLDTELHVLELVLTHAQHWGWHFATEFCWERPGLPQQAHRRFKNAFEPVFQFTLGEWKFRPEEVRVRSTSAFAYDPDESKSASGNQGRDLSWSAERKGGGWAFPSNRLPTFAGSHLATGHAAAFPVGLPAWFARAYTDPGDVIYDPFMGSGSTLLAAEQEGRVGLGAELSPAYCDVIVTRWEEATGQTATRP